MDSGLRFQQVMGKARNAAAQAALSTTTAPVAPRETTPPQTTMPAAHSPAFPPGSTSIGTTLPAATDFTTPATTTTRQDKAKKTKRRLGSTATKPKTFRGIPLSICGPAAVTIGFVGAVTCPVSWLAAYVAIAGFRSP